MCSGRRGPCWSWWQPIWYGIVPCFHHVMCYEQGTTWQSPSLFRSNMWLLSSSWNPSAHLAHVLELWRYSPSVAMLTPAISPLSGRLMEGGNILFLPVQVQRTCPLPRGSCYLFKIICENQMFYILLSIEAYWCLLSLSKKNSFSSSFFVFFPKSSALTILVYHLLCFFFQKQTTKWQHHRWSEQRKRLEQWVLLLFII